RRISSSARKASADDEARTRAPAPVMWLLTSTREARLAKLVEPARTAAASSFSPRYPRSRLCRWPKGARPRQGRNALDRQGIGSQRERAEPCQVGGLGQRLRPLVRNLVVRQAQSAQAGQRRGSGHGLEGGAGPLVRE